MQELKKRKSKKATNLERKHSRRSIKSDSLHVPLTPSTLQKTKTAATRPSTAKSGSREERKFVGEREPLVRLSHARPSEVPENVAVHFASFYQNQDQILPHSTREKAVGLEAKTSRSFPKMEFTRQMVYKLENSAGTQNYGRQVSAVLEDTVESPGFNLKLPPIDNCAPLNVPSNYYPLWYRDPNKMPQISRRQFQKMKNEYQGKMATKKIGKKLQKPEESMSESSGTEAKEFETGTESEEDGTCCKTYSKSYLSIKNSKSLGIAEKLATSIAKEDSKNSLMVNPNAKSIHRSFSDHSSWSSQTSCEITAEDDEEESLDWETDAEEEVDQITIKIVHNYRENYILNHV